VLPILSTQTRGSKGELPPPFLGPPHAHIPLHTGCPTRVATLFAPPCFCALPPLCANGCTGGTVCLPSPFHPGHPPLRRLPHSHCKGSSALGHKIGHFCSFQSPRSCHASPLILDIATNSLIFPHVSISPRIYAFFILPSTSQFVVPCLVIFLFLPPSSDAPHCSSHSNFRVTTFQDHLSAVSNCDTDGLKPSFLASCFLHHLSTIHSFYRFHHVLLTPLIFCLGRSTLCLL